jgi:hypothetical protein
VTDSEWQDVTGSAINLKKDPGPHIGMYVGSEARPSKFGEGATDYTHNFIGEDGAPWSCYGMTSLDRVMKRIPSGTKVRITFNGKKKTKDGKREFNDVSVQIPKGVQLQDEDPTRDAPTFDPDTVPF